MFPGRSATNSGPKIWVPPALFSGNERDKLVDFNARAGGTYAPRVMISAESFPNDKAINNVFTSIKLPNRRPVQARGFVRKPFGLSPRVHDQTDTSRDNRPRFLLPVASATHSAVGNPAEQ